MLIDILAECLWGIKGVNDVRFFEERDIVTAMVHYRLRLESDLSDDVGLPGERIELEVGYVLYELCELIGIRPSWAAIAATFGIAKEVDAENAGISYSSKAA